MHSSFGKPEKIFLKCAYIFFLIRSGNILCPRNILIFLSFNFSLMDFFHDIFARLLSMIVLLYVVY
jgi:hypothetical protein